MKIKYIATGMAALLFALTSCDDTTNTIGSSLIDYEDRLDVKADTFDVSSKTVLAGSVLSRNINGYLGRVKDPETGTYVKGDVMIQLHMLNSYSLNDESYIVSRDKDNKIIADSCEIRLMYSSFIGDSLAQMKMTAYELNKPMEENVTYYSDFDPIGEGYVTSNCFSQNRTYTLADHTQTDNIRYSSSPRYIRLMLNNEYTDKNDASIKYNNFGTYLLRKYYENPANFKDSYKFLHNVTPGFFFKITNGVGSMAKINAIQVFIYFRTNTDGTENKVSTSFVSTEEVLQTTTFTNDENALKELADDNSCTYLKTPAGLFTELTLPIEDETIEVNGVAKYVQGIMTGHENDSINTAKIEIFRKNNQTLTDYSLPIPQTLLIIPVDDVKNFFENSLIADYSTTYLATYSSSRNSYIFNNVAGLINTLIKRKKDGTATDENWNKVLVIPVTTEYSTVSSSTTQMLSKVSHDISLTSTRLMKGTVTDSPIKISIIYGKFYGR